MNNINKILIIRLSSIGDIVLTTALIRCIKKKFPASEIDFLVKKEFSDLLKFNPNLSKLIEYDKTGGYEKLRTLGRELKLREYDLFIDIHRNLRSLYLRSIIKAGKTASYSKQLIKRALLVKTGWNLYKIIKPVLERYFESVHFLNVQYDGKGTEIFIPDDITQKIRHELKNHGFKTNQKLIVICPGASFANKRWPLESFSFVVDYFNQKEDVFLAFAGGRQDFELCKRLKKNSSDSPVNFAGSFDLLESAALLKEASVVITNDSGLMHIAQAVKRPVVAIFGPTTAELGFYPLIYKSIVIENDVSCRPCTSKGLNHCPEKHFKCMLNNDPQEVIEAVERFL